ncbi:hypothetical protein Zmor_011213 [Zophobas morio]|uniref:Tyr recombinase domain-containing protein n=1 Tax=Zophobas morio TaxID=2755281 RepID=A0AA38MKM4_9CUCU|nr:hypothetical protein Zmor_011213 [Zophobas morio]
MQKRLMALKGQDHCRIRTFSQVLGSLVSLCPAIPYGPLHLKLLEQSKFAALKKSQGNYEGTIRISNIVQGELTWWQTTIPSALHSLVPPSISMEIFTDASKTGWGGGGQLVESKAPPRVQPKLVLPFFKTNPKLCVASTLKHYVKITAPLRGSIQQLFLTHKKPHRAASGQTIARWIRTTLSRSGVDTQKFGAHSTRHASTSSASRAGVSLEVIKSVAAWGPKSAVFARFYNRPLSNTHTFAETVLKPFSDSENLT